MAPWLDIAREFGLYAGRGIPTPETFRALGLPTKSIFFTRTSDVKKWDECPMEYRYTSMDTRVPAATTEPAWAQIGHAIHALASSIALVEDKQQIKAKIHEMAVGMSESAMLTPSEYDERKLTEGALLIAQLGDVMQDPKIFPKNFGFKRVIASEEDMWLWIPAWAIGVCNGDPHAIQYATQQASGVLNKPRPAWAGCFGVVMMFKVDIIGENENGKTELLQIKSYGDDDVEVLSTLLSFGLHEMVYNIGVSLVAQQERWPEVEESSLLAIKKEVRANPDVPVQKTILDALEKGKVSIDEEGTMRRVDCTDKQWERFAGMRQRWTESVCANQHHYDTWPWRVIQFMQLDQKFEQQKRLFMALGRRLGAILQAEDVPSLLHLTPNNESACKKMYGRPCAYRYAYGCGGYDDLQNPIEWRHRDLDYVNKASMNFTAEVMNNGSTQ